MPTPYRKAKNHSAAFGLPVIAIERPKMIGTKKPGSSTAAIQRARLRDEDGKAQAIVDVRGELGARVPNDTELVEADTAAQEVLSVAPKKVSAPVVLATSAG